MISLPIDPKVNVKAYWYKFVCRILHEFVHIQAWRLKQYCITAVGY